MVNIIEFANNTIDACVKCNIRPNCKWFGIVAENVVLDDITPEEYANLTYEEIATKIHENAGEPECEDQHSLDGILELIEGMIEHATIPNFSQELIGVLNKMSRLEKRLKRLPEDCRDVFDAIIRAIVERCLSAIDYHYLDAGIDIYPLIQNIHADYRRTKMLHQYYLEGVVNVLLSRAKKLTLEQIIAWKDPLWQLRDVNLTPSVDINSIDLGDSEPAPKYREPDEPDLQQDDTHFVIESPVVICTITTSTPQKATRSFIRYITSQEVTNYIKAFSMSFGFDPTPARSIDDFFDPDFISKNIMPRMDFEFDQMPAVYKEMANEVRKRKANDGDLHMYICSLFSEVNYVGLLLFPRYNDLGQQKHYILFENVDIFSNHSRKDFSNAWAESMANTEKQYTINDKEYFNDLVDGVGDFLFTHCTPEHDRSMTGIADLRNLYRQYIAAIEAALLINKVEHNCLYYGLDIGACYTRNIPYNFIPAMTGLSQHAVDNLATNLGHNLVRPGEKEFFQASYPDLAEEYVDSSEIKKPTPPADDNAPEKYHLAIPEGISALEEVKLRFAGQDAKAPITAFLVKAGYETFVVCPHEDYETMDHQTWAEIHSEEWDRYLFDRWDDLRDEISSAIKARVKDKLELKKYVCGLITPFDYYGYYDRFRFDWNTFAEPLDVIGYFIHSLHDNSDTFLKVWREVVEKLHAEDEQEHYSFEDYQKRLCEIYNEKDKVIHEQTDSREWEAFENRQDFPAKYCGLIAGCLLENGAPLEYMDYQEMCGVELVEQLETFDISRAMNWTDDLVLSYNPKKVVRSEPLWPPSKGEIKTKYFSYVPGDKEETFTFPDEFLRAKDYLDVLKEHGFLDDHYKWANKEGSLNYHAAWASKIISYNCNPVGTSKENRITHDKMGKLFGIPNLGTYVTDAKNKLAVTGLIERLFKEKGLSIQLP